MMPLKMFAPASIGNFAVGFDLLGAAIKPIDGSLLGDVIEVSRHGIGQLHCKGPFANQLPKDLKQNIVYECLQLFNQALKQYAIVPENLQLTLQKNLPVGSGLGSSASSIVAALNALNYWYKKPLAEHQLLKLMGQAEKKISGSLHYDNVAPSFKGGLQLMSHTAKISNPLPFPKHWQLIIANPGSSISTKQAREQLPKQLSQATAIEFASLLANFCRAIYSKQYRHAAYFLQDVIAEPYRKNLFSDYDKHKQSVIQMGALCFAIAGSGSTVFAITDEPHIAESVQNYLAQNYSHNSSAFSHICELDQQGSRLISS